MSFVSNAFFSFFNIDSLKNRIWNFYGVPEEPAFLIQNPSNPHIFSNFFFSNNVKKKYLFIKNIILYYRICIEILYWQLFLNKSILVIFIFPKVS